MGGDFSFFTIVTGDKKVQRKETDFYFLRKALTIMYPHTIIPPLAQQTKKDKRLIDKVLTKRQRVF